MTIKDFNKLHPLKVIIVSNPTLHPLSVPSTANNNYYCLARDFKGFQVEVDLQALPAGVTLNQIEPNQVWWVDKRTNLYRLTAYGGTYNPTTKQVTSTSYLPVDPDSPFLTISGGTISGNLTVGNNLTVSGTSTFATPPSVMGKWQTSNTSTLPLTSTQEITQTVSGYSNYLITLNSQCLNGDASVGHNAVVILKENTTSATLISRTAGMNANSYATVSITWLYTASAGTSYTFAGFLNQGGASAGTAANTITILGFN